MLGLSENETRMYVAILENPHCDALFLKEKMKLSKACVYKILRQLFDKGFVERNDQLSLGTHKVMPLSKIGMKLSSHGRKLERIGQAFQGLHEEHCLNDRTEIREYDEQKDYYLEIAEKAKDFIWCVGSYKAGEIFNGRDLEVEFIKRRLKKGAHANAIIFDNFIESKELAQRDNLEKRSTRFIAQNYYPREFTYLFEDTCAHFFEDKGGKVKIIEIISPAYAKAKLMQFQKIWESSSA